MTRLGAKFKDERGISTVVVVVALIGLFGAVMLSLDYGNTVSTRRNLITGTDATALNRAKFEFNRSPALAGPGPIDCPEAEGIWAKYLALNVGSYNLTGIDHPCAVYPNGTTGTGYVVIQARKDADTRFGGVLGIGDTHPFSLSAAQYGFAIAARGLRPIGFCNANEHVQEWLAPRLATSDGGTSVTPDEQDTYDDLRGSGADHPTAAPKGPYVTGYPTTGVVHRMHFIRQGGDGPCGETAGNWGWMDFNCTWENQSSCANPDPALTDWLNDPAYQGLVNLWQLDPSLPPPADVNGTALCDRVENDEFREVGPTRGCINGTDGLRLGSLSRPLNDLVDKGTRFHVPIFNHVDGTGNNAKFQIYGFLGVRLWYWDQIPGPPGGGNDGIMDMEFFELLLDGSCCSTTPVPGGQPGLKICAVDHDGDTSDAVIAARCGQ